MSRRHRSHSTEFKRQVVAEYHTGETLHALSRRHDLSRNLIRIWIEKAEAGALDEDAAAAELLADYEARIAALERLVGKQALEIEFLKGAARSRPSQKSAPTGHDVRRLMNGERAILFATDPPYLVDYDGSNHPTRNKDWSASYGTTWDDSSQGAELYDGFIVAAVAEAITEDAAWYCWHASRRQAMLEACWEKAGAFVHQQIIWVKDRGVLTRSHYLWKHEPCFMGWRRPNRPPKVAEETLPSTWEMPSFAKDERPDHPTPKPLDAFGIPMRQHVARGGLCYEPFSGSGSQIMAGDANGRRVFAMEISPAYVDVAVERWQAETGRDAILDGDGRTFAEVKAERLGETPAAAEGAHAA